MGRAGRRAEKGIEGAEGKRTGRAHCPSTRPEGAAGGGAAGPAAVLKHCAGRAGCLRRRRAPRLFLPRPAPPVQSRPRACAEWAARGALPGGAEVEQGAAGRCPALPGFAFCGGVGAVLLRLLSVSFNGEGGCGEDDDFRANAVLQNNGGIFSAL